MTATAHAMTGAAIAAVIKKPKLAIPLAFLSHFVCDALPHFGAELIFGTTKMYTYLFIEGLVMLLLAAFLLKKKVANPLLLAVCAFAAMSPDLAWLFYGLKDQQGQVASMDPLSHFHYVIQWGETKAGLIFDVAWVSLMLTIVLKVNSKNQKDIRLNKTQ